MIIQKFLGYINQGDSLENQQKIVLYSIFRYMSKRIQQNQPVLFIDGHIFMCKGKKNKKNGTLSLIWAVNQKEILARQYFKGILNFKIFVKFLRSFFKSYERREEKSLVVVRKSKMYSTNDDVFRELVKQRIKVLNLDLI